jgi:ABC-type uncharacterized transport system substrate-binding protein
MPGNEEVRFMRRREFIALAGGGAVLMSQLWPGAVHAQQGGVRRVGVLSLGARDTEMLSRMASFRQGLAALGWTEGNTLRFEERWAGGEGERLRADAAELIGLKPDVILAAGGRALDALVHDHPPLPIVFIGLSDPVGQGFVTSLARPGANITGFSATEATVVGKTLEALKGIAPKITRVALLAQRENPNLSGYIRAIEQAAPTLGVHAESLAINDPSEIDGIIARFGREPAGGLIVLPDLFMAVHSEQLLALAAQHKLPAAYPYRDYVSRGGLMSYGIDNIDVYRRAASYVDRILRGDKPGELPVQSPSKFELVVNMRTANALGLTIPLTLLASADEVIE